MEECQKSLLKEKKDHNSTKADMNSKLETATVQGNYYQELLAEHGLASLLETRPRLKNNLATRKRSNTVVPTLHMYNTEVFKSNSMI